MPDILHEVTIASTPAQVFTALTEAHRLEAWWVTHAIAEPEVGSMIQVSFGDNQFSTELEILTFEPDRKIEWAVRQAPIPDWHGTDITWELTPAGSGTKVLFGHRGYTSTGGMLPLSSYHWAVYLTSLKDYLETGKGNPFPFST